MIRDPQSFDQALQAIDRHVRERLIPHEALVEAQPQGQLAQPQRTVAAQLAEQRALAGAAAGGGLHRGALGAHVAARHLAQQLALRDR